MAEIEDNTEGSGRLKLRTSFVLVKTLISVCLSCLSAFVIRQGDFSAHQCSGEDESLCQFQWVCFGFSVFMTLPVLSESLLLNKVFFDVITSKEGVSERQAVLFQYYLKVGKKYLGCFANVSKERVDDVSYDGAERLQKAFNRVKRMRALEKVSHHIKALFGLFVLIPILFVWRLVYRSIQTVLYLPRFHDPEVRAELYTAWKSLVILPMLMLNDPICVLLIFPLSYVVIFSSNS